MDHQDLAPERLSGLAHRLRLRLLVQLRADGPATATILAKRLGESSGATSYHLRQLARHGFVEPDDRPRRGRERWWRASAPTHRIDEPSLARDPELAGVLDAYLREVLSAQAALVREWVADQARWSADWQAASTTSGIYLRLSAPEARRLLDELVRIIERYREAPAGVDALPYVVQLNGFPRRPA